MLFIIIIIIALNSALPAFSAAQGASQSIITPATTSFKGHNLVRAGISRISTKVALLSSIEYYIHMVAISLLGTDYCSVVR